MSPARQVRKRAPTRRTEAVDRDAARDLELTIENDGRLYESQFLPIVRNLMKKRRAGTYRHDLAVKAFGYLVESGAKAYSRDVGRGTPWHALFSVPTRHAVAESLTNSFEGEADLGNYDHLAPSTGTSQAAKRVKTPAELRNDIARVTGVKVR